ncbi:MAG: hypothetical protein Kapaf2KO_22840 [Candidatus Kapaibacteriales bacterium]
MKIIKYIFIFLFYSFLQLFISGCECVVSDDIEYDSVPQETVDIDIVTDLYGLGNEGSPVEFNIGDITQFTLPALPELPFKTKIESGSQLLSAESEGRFYFSSTVITEPGKSYIGIAWGEELFAEFELIDKAEISGWNVFNASSSDITINNINIINGNMISFDSDDELILNQNNSNIVLNKSSNSTGIITVLSSENEEPKYVVL